jgi:hypothetical protein
MKLHEMRSLDLYANQRRKPLLREVLASIKLAALRPAAGLTSDPGFEIVLSPCLSSPFGPESFDPEPLGLELVAERLTAEGLVTRNFFLSSYF